MTKCRSSRSPGCSGIRSLGRSLTPTKRGPEQRPCERDKNSLRVWHERRLPLQIGRFGWFLFPLFGSSWAVRPRSASDRLRRLPDVSRAIGECVGLLPLADLSNRRCAGRRGISSDISGATGRPLLPLEGTHAMICHRGAICRRHQRIKLKQATRRFGPQTICEHGSSAKHAGPSLDI